MAYNNITKISISMLIVIVILTSIYIFGFNNENFKEIPIINYNEVKTRIKPQDGEKLAFQSTKNVIYESVITSNPTSSVTLMKKNLTLSEPEQPISFRKHQPLAEKIKIDEDIFSIEDDTFQDNNLYQSLSIFDDDTGSISKDDLFKPNLNQKKALNITQCDKEHSNKIKKRSIESNKGKSYMIQLASVKSESEGIAIGEILKHKYRKVLSPYSITLKKIKDKNERFLYLVLAGNCSNFSVAKAICKKLSLNQQPCMIIKP